MLLKLPIPGPADLPIPGPRALGRQLIDTATSILDTNRAGQAYGFLAITPIRPGQEAALRATLAKIDRRQTSPFARIARTHFARWVVLEDFDTGADFHPQDEDRLGCQYLIFSACFDGDLDSWLDELIDELAPEIEAVWSHCIGVEPTAPADVKRYLLHNQQDSGLFYSAYPHATVPEVRRVLKAQRDLRALAVRRHELTPQELRDEFLEHFGRR
ncbi:MAG: hypothetical protein Q7T55_08220 [Solirubrobacteraceae bacterium]|nr:hypothetical protein [Solirubrobacteraceae bacterium]